MRRALVFVLAGALACGDDAPATRDETVADSAPAATAAPATPLFVQRTAVFLLADSAEFAYLRELYGPDFEVVADDMMWYRAEALGFLERNQIPIVYFEGRPALRFRVRGVEQQHDFGDVETADVVVLYEPDSVPRAVATIDVSTVAPEYFGLE